MARLKNTYIKGIDQDTALDKRDPSTYYSAENISILLNEELASGAITNIRGTLNLDLLAHLKSGIIPTTYVNEFSFSAIVGAVSIRDNLILFVVGSEINNPFSIDNVSFIFKLTINEGGITSCTLLYSDFNTTDDSKLNLSASYPIRGTESYYESDKIQKVFWSDFKTTYEDFHPLRMMNIVTNYWISSQSKYVSAFTFNIIQPITPTKPVIESVTNGGDIKSGLIQYAYQLYNKYENSTNVSYLSDLVHITPSNDYNTTSIYYKGGTLDYACGKAVKLYINIADQDFNRIKVYSIKYNTLELPPTINIIYDGDISSDIYVTDSGSNYVGTVILEEFVKLFDNFTAKDIINKNNILFAANIATKNFDFDYDARAYRYPRSSSTTKLFHSDESTYDSYGTTPDPGAKHHYYMNKFINLVPETHDCINTVNKIQYLNFDTSISSSNYFLFQYNSTVLGGTGLNVSYSFSLDNQLINECESTCFENYTTIDGTYPDYASYSKVSIRDWQRDEVYRFGLVGYDANLQPSTVKWIGDIRMPAHNHYDTNTPHATNDATSNGYGAFTNTTTRPGYGITSIGTLTHNRLSIVFEVTNLPEEVKYYEIVYVKREDTDKTVLTEGILDSLHATTVLSMYRTYPSIDTYNDHTHLTFISPDILYNKDLTYETGDYINFTHKLLGHLGTYYLPNLTDLTLVLGHATLSAYSFQHYSAQYVPAGNTVSINSMYYVGPAAGVEGYSVDINAGLQYLNRYGDVSDEDHSCSGGSKLILKLNDILYHAPGGLVDDSELTYYVSYKRPRSAQYKGNTYNARLTNTYISASNAVPSAITLITADKGDVYAGMMEYLNLIHDSREDVELIDNKSAMITFPVISKYNPKVQTNKSISQSIVETNGRLLQETKGAQSYTYDGTTYLYDQEDSLYQYNTVYNRLSDIMTFFPKQEDYQPVTYNDGLTKYSDTKLPNDYIESWSIFRYLNSNIVASEYGPINKLTVLNNYLIFIQDKAIGMWYVNNKEVISTDNPGALAIGSGGVLQQSHYFTTTSGSKHQFSVVKTPTGIIYYDDYNKGIYKFSGQQEQPISKITGLSSKFKDLVVSEFNGESLGVLTSYDKKNLEILYTFRPNNADPFTVVYNDLGQHFYTFLSIHPEFGYTHNTMLLTSSNLADLHMHNNGPRGRLYDTYADSNIELILTYSEQYQSNQLMFDSLRFVCNYTDHNNNFVPAEGSTLKLISCKTSYQDSGDVDVVYEDNIIKRNNIYRLRIPREEVTESRLADTYLRTKLTFINNGTKFTMNDIETNVIMNTV